MWPMRMHRQLASGAADDRLACLTLSEYCRSFELEHKLPVGLGLRCMKLLMWQHFVEFDLETPKPECLRLDELTVRQTLRLRQSEPQPA